MENLQIGTFGWQHDAWLDSFYPGDLPEDWQLDYFSNAFRTVLVPQSVWQAWDADTLEAVNDAVEGDFYFYLAIESKTALLSCLETLKGIKKVLLDKLPGLVVLPSVAFSSSAAALSAVEGLAESTGLPLTLITEQADGRQPMLPGWSWSHSEVCISGQPLAYITDLTADGRAQAALLQSFYASLPLEGAAQKKGAPVMIGSSVDSTIDMQQVANLRVVCEFLGY